MSDLTAADRNRLKSSQFGMPGERKYPMPDRSHAANAKSRAAQMLAKGLLGESSYQHIVAMANRKLGEK